MAFTFGELFAGIGGIGLGLERAGMKVVWQVERDPYCLRVLAKHWPNVKRYEDVKDVGAHNLEPVDLICGGPPCQPVSVAGKRRAQDDERWMWPEFARIVRELRPRFVLMENVPGLLVRGFGDVLGDLAALGYDAEWGCVSAASVGAPHLRRRVFIIGHSNGQHEGTLAGVRKGSTAEPSGSRDAAHANGDPIRLQQEPGSQCVGKAEPRNNGTDGEVADAAHQAHVRGVGQHGDAKGPRGGRDDHTRGATSDVGWWSVEPNVGRVAHGVPSRVDRLRALGNAVVPQVAEYIGHRIMSAAP